MAFFFVEKIKINHIYIRNLFTEKNGVCKKLKKNKKRKENIYESIFKQIKKGTRSENKCY